jgi:hypothetical protein
LILQLAVHPSDSNSETLPMRDLRSSLCSTCALALLLVLAGSVQAQDAPKAGAAPAAAPAAKKGPYRVLAPGVEITIAPDQKEDDTFSTHDVVEILNGIPNLKWTPKTEPITSTIRDMATATVFRHNIWYLEFTFQPMKMIWVDVPQASGKMQRKLIWYMVYRVKNNGKHFKPVRKADGTYDVQRVDHPVRFVPQFVLESSDQKKAYLDRLIPVAIPAIQQHEDPNRDLLNSVQISEKPIPLSTERADNSVWGVATWESIDPRVDFFSVSIQGLTNAYKWTDQPAEFKVGDPPGKGRVLTEKTLVLNFWRPGDEFVEDQRAIRYGAPGQVDYSWVYR